ncbi:Heavy-metal-associated domain and membrane-bounded cytochrome biogenesis cycZ-like domain, membrane copper tolerance protein [Lysobacter dokdonensis DS-58]|uniref:Heavy-metal-associated domain and membrane-bounded cytochrome biogenesis cycZ-like domain, membrane copper tolerance protein n=1 Tax=Lysobacter dokdonensis DS-58 TaxID=1300345 RepID=A0A0A2WIL0_9GAMM|nr:sulfite exporter TauE/SafE family protein [Lysobacter dokdonensis]KGQ20031.1 Heavy-metal-associated domain and membrane-bounded cytochrome biogenesis cycZ-like domain, membrane copper tolerance protein [Lysobacter dokdonensis DS-58]
MTLDWLVLGGALLTGLLGGAHCAAMCGGIATGLSIGQRGGWWIAAQPNLGRIAGYVIAGALAGGVGQAVLDVARVPGLVVASRAAVGIVLVLAALRLLDRSGRLSFLALPGAGLWQRLRPLQRRLLPADTAGKRIGLGVLWGWMPCGLSTQLLVAAWLQASAWHGALTMLAFGLATLPVMLPLTWAGARFGQRLQRGAWRTGSAMVVLFAGLATLAGPWLVQVPALHGALQALGCRSLA